MASSAHAGTVVAARPAQGLALRRGGLRLTRYAVMLVLAVFFLLPYVWMVSGSLRTQNEIFANLYPLSIWTFVPKQWTLASFQALLQLQPFPFTHYVWNSLVVAFTVTGFSLLVNSWLLTVWSLLAGRPPECRAGADCVRVGPLPIQLGLVHLAADRRSVATGTSHSGSDCKLRQRPGCAMGPDLRRGGHRQPTNRSPVRLPAALLRPGRRHQRPEVTTSCAQAIVQGASLCPNSQPVS